MSVNNNFEQTGLTRDTLVAALNAEGVNAASYMPSGFASLAAYNSKRLSRPNQPYWYNLLKGTAILLITAVTLMAGGACLAQPSVQSTPLAKRVDTNQVSRYFFVYDQDGHHTNWLADEPEHGYSGGLQTFLGLTGPAFDRWARYWFWPLPDAQYAAGAGLKFRIFTPHGVDKVANPGPDERPYAGWLTTSFAIQQRNRWIEDHIGIELGTIGPRSGADRFQQRIHPALGWHTQLKNEYTVNMRLRRAWRWRYQSPPALTLDLIPDVSADIGNVYRRAGAGLMLRAGFRVPDDFVQPGIEDPGSQVGQSHQWSVYGYVRFGFQAVQHNLFLDGNTWVDSRSVDRKPLVGDFSLGIVAQLGPLAALQWSWTRLTDEFRTDHFSDSYGSLMLRFSF